ncbi:hypothetical protein [Reichenbachiella versicolor]|uniref:hypothetical protein n=1 Tax=Reichenbachiella versicolor TaxID=1821036 RepID=UPI000D6DE6A1|nr:hypothetical protein [Reichenbachiella versicolor]
MNMEEWKKDIMGSLDGIQRAEPPADLFAKIQDSIVHSEAVKKIKWQLVAASVIIILGCNLFVAKDYLTTKNQPKQELQLPYSSNFNIY